MYIKKLVLSLSALLCFGIGMAQVETSSEIYKTLKTNDSLLFDVGFNTCDLASFEQLISDDLEFYHDTSGITNSKAGFVRSFKSNICGNPNSKSKRALIPGSLEVFPLYNNGELYGALQKGEHRFYEQKDSPGTVAKFTHLWLKTENTWVLKRVLSYDHQSEAMTSGLKEISLSESQLSNFTGTYKAPKTGTVVILPKNGVLEMKAGNMQALIYPTSASLFFHKEAPLTFEFVRNEQGKVEKMIVMENGTIVEEAIKE